MASPYIFKGLRLAPQSGPGSKGSKGSKGKVLKMDGPSAQGFLSLTAFQAEGCGIALRAMSIIMPPFGGHVHIEYHNHSSPRPHRLRWMASHWIRGSRGSPMNPVRLQSSRDYSSLSHHRTYRSVYGGSIPWADYILIALF